MFNDSCLLALLKIHYSLKIILLWQSMLDCSLVEVLADHMNAEIVAGTISSKQDAMDYLTWTYFFRRLLMNPTYYHLEDTSQDSINEFLSNLVQSTTCELARSFCIEVAEVKFCIYFFDSLILFIFISLCF